MELLTHPNRKMTMITLTDNNLGGNGKLYDRKDISELFPIADKTIADLCKENENLLIFPQRIAESGDKIDKLPILSIQNTSDPDKVLIRTGNVMGFIGIGKLQLKIQSRFDKDNDNDQKGRADFFLHYMLQKVLSFNLFNLNHNNEQDDVFDFIMFMFPHFLNAALNQGVYREYQHYKYNNAHVRGTIDVGRHIEKNNPFVGKIAYSTREYSYDNNITQLIRHTIEFIKTRKYGSAILRANRDCIENVKIIMNNTASYNKSHRNSVISKNLRVKSHPYYTEYKPLQILCLQILRMEEMKYGDKDKELCGILFDGAWLWEEYVNMVLRNFDMGFKHPENKENKDAIYLFEGNSGRRFPDFYKDGFVLDAKYKRLGSYKKVSDVDRDDVHQIITYMHCLKSPRGGFVAPLESKQQKVPTSRLKDSSETISIFGIEINQTAQTYDEFCQAMAENEKTFVDSLDVNLKSLD